MERKRLRHIHRQFSNELQNIEQEILQASINKLKREAAERSGEASEISDGYMTPAEDTESLNSDSIFSMAQVWCDTKWKLLRAYCMFSDLLRQDSFGAGATEEERLRKRGLLMRLDENSEVGPFRHHHPHHHQHMLDLRAAPTTTKARPVMRRSISRELFEVDQHRQSQARPVARRSISRELFSDANFIPGGGEGGGRLVTSMQADFDQLRNSLRQHRERSLGREDPFMADFMGGGGGPVGAASSASRSMSLSRQNNNGGRMNGSMGLTGVPPTGPPRAPSALSSQGRSITQSDFSRSRFPGLRSQGDEDLSAARFGRLASLDERGRADWRRISVPERGKDFKSLPRKYNR